MILKSIERNPEGVIIAKYDFESGHPDPNRKSKRIPTDLLRHASVVEDKRWPTILLPLKLLAKPEDSGAGDVIARTIGPIGGYAFKVWYKTLFGQDCGCGTRQEMLNQRWPL